MASRPEAESNDPESLFERYGSDAHLSVDELRKELGRLKRKMASLPLDILAEHQTTMKAAQHEEPSEFGNMAQAELDALRANEQRKSDDLLAALDTRPPRAERGTDPIDFAKELAGTCFFRILFFLGILKERLG
jgi:hypothetical protein